MDFEKAVIDYRFAAMRFDTGYIDEETFLGEVAALEGEDSNGRPWRIEAMSGNWQVREDGEWKVAVPPGLESSDAERYHNIDALKSISKGKWILWLGLILGVGILVAEPAAREDPLSLFAGILFFMAFTWFISRRNSGGSWSGSIVEIYDSRIIGEEGKRKRMKAHVRLDGGGMTTVDAMPSWKVGDRIEKLEGFDMPVRR